MKKKRLLVSLVSLCLALVLAALFLMTACAKPTPAPAPTPTPTPTPAPAPKPVELIMAHIDPPASIQVELEKWWINEVETRTGGALTIEPYWACTLATPKEMPESVSTGTIDIGYCPYPVYHSHLFPLHSMTTNVMGFRTKPLAMWMAAEVCDEEFPEWQAEYAANNMKRLTNHGEPTYHILSVKPIRTLEDLKGLKMFTTGSYHFTLLEAVGAVPVAIATPEALDSLQKGVVQGTLTSIQTTVNFGFYEVANYFTHVGFGGDPHLGSVMNLDRWNELPPDVQQVFMELRGEYPVRYSEMVIKDLQEKYKIAEEAGVEITDLPATDVEAWRNKPEVKAVKEAWIKWAVENSEVSESRIREMVERYLELVDEMEESYPEVF